MAHCLEEEGFILAVSEVSVHVLQALRQRDIMQKGSGQKPAPLTDAREAETAGGAGERGRGGMGIHLCSHTVVAFIYILPKASSIHL